MSRPLRLAVAGGWYHVMARGHGRGRIYLGDRDYRHFLALVGKMAEAHRVEVHAYVLMPNHYHLLIRTPEANVSRAIQWLNQSYGVWWNRRHAGSGQVFGGRFKSVLVEGGAWVLALSLYLHFNPVAVKGLGLGKRDKKAEALGLKPPTQAVVKARLDSLRSYRWSSYRGYAGYEHAAVWLKTEEILRRVKGGREGYRRLVEDRMRQGQAEDGVWSKLRWGVVLGSERFADEMRNRLKAGRESPGRRELNTRASWEAVVAAVEGLKQERWEHFADRHGDWGRDLAL